MKCKICGAESGKYPLCRGCNIKKEKGEILKCEKCGKWHYATASCPAPTIVTANENYLYEVKKTLISKSEQGFYSVIKSAVPEEYCVFPQINLASFIERTDDARFHNELFRNIDFLITDSAYMPKFIIEINDQTHLTNERKERDEKVKKICEEAGIPILNLWTSYGVNPDYISGRINEILNNLPVKRIRHFTQAPTPVQPVATSMPQSATAKKQGCYIATCVYGSYDCPKVWALRRYRDDILASVWYGRVFIRAYYAISPVLVKWFGKKRWFKALWESVLDKLISKICANGIDNTPYNDRMW